MPIPYLKVLRLPQRMYYMYIHNLSLLICIPAIRIVLDKIEH